jgi:P4 family phage/plasmid primase-like protien
MDAMKMKFLEDYLYDELKGTYEGAMPATKVNDEFESDLIVNFENHVYLSGRKYFLAGKGGRLYVYNGKGFEGVNNEVIKECSKAVIKRLALGNVYVVKTPQKIQKECMDGIFTNGDYEFKPDRKYIVFDNCVLKLGQSVDEEDELLEHSQHYMTDIVMDFDYVRGYRFPLWEQKLKEIIPKREMREAFQLFCGAILANRDNFKIEYVCFLLGCGGNGKSVLVHAIANVFGRELFSCFSPHQLFKSQQAMYHLAALDGKLANLCDDVSNESFANGDFKRFVSGDSMQARHPYGKDIFYVQAPMMLCCANEMPASGDDTEGYHRRVLPIYSTEHSCPEEERDPNLTAKLSTPEARMGIFNWILEGYNKVRMNNGKILLGDEVKQAQKDLKEDNNSVRRWIRDRKYIRVEEEGGEAKGKTVGFLEMYNDYLAYCEENKEFTPQKVRSVGTTLKAIFKEGPRKDNKRTYLVGTASGDIKFASLPSAMAADDELPF